MWKIFFTKLIKYSDGAAAVAVEVAVEVAVAVRRKVIFLQNVTKRSNTL